LVLLYCFTLKRWGIVLLCTLELNVLAQYCCTF